MTIIVRVLCSCHPECDDMKVPERGIVDISPSVRSLNTSTAPRDVGYPDIPVLDNYHNYCGVPPQ